MKKLFVSLVVVAVAVTSCQKDVVYNDMPEQNQSVELPSSNTRSYDEALAIAEDALKLLESDETRSTTKRVIKRNEGQTVMRPVTRGGEVNEEPIMYVFNNEDNQGFTIIAANRAQQPLIAVTELGNYTYGEPTGVEPFDLLMDDVVSTLSITPPEIIIPDTPITPTPGYYTDTVDIYDRIDPLIATKWHQSGIFGSKCTNSTSGCAATAFGQIMTCHGYPSSVILTYKNNDNLSLNWLEIRRIITGNEFFIGDRVAKESIGMLLREVGERMEMIYLDEGGSGTNEENMLVGIHSLGYSSARLKTNTTVNMEFGSVKSSILNGYPVIVTGVRQDNIGHVWVADGIHHREYRINVYVANPNYDPSIIYNNPEPQYILSHKIDEVYERLIHYNWGAEDGLCNGWFTTNCYNLEDGESYDSSETSNRIEGDGNYCFDVSVIYNIQPNN